MADIRAIGLGVPGVVIKGRVFNAYNLHWDEVAIQSILRRRLRVPVLSITTAICLRWAFIAWT